MNRGYPSLFPVAMLDTTMTTKDLEGKDLFQVATPMSNPTFRKVRADTQYQEPTCKG